jgi:hypothetical protein
MIDDTDARFRNLVDPAREELSMYLSWIAENELPDTEQMFVDFVIGRIGAVDGRHVFTAWCKMYESDNISELETLEVMRFFTNPSDADFTHSETSGWFELISPLYSIIDEVESKASAIPRFEKIGTSSNVKRKEFIDVLP